jgi:hypothetical protein
MKLDWHIEPEDVRSVQELCARMASDALVRERYESNVTGVRRPEPTPANIWKALVNCHLTTVARSGPNSAANRLITHSPFPLALSACKSSTELEVFIAKTLKDFGGIRRYYLIARGLTQNLTVLEGGGWSEVENTVASLQCHSTAATERRAADEIASRFWGIGPKQARNFLQMLGAARFETPLDIRVVTWLNQNGFAIHLSAGALGDTDYYAFVMHGVQTMCKEAGVLPCIFDASVFASVDRGGWSESSLMWANGSSEDGV